MRKPNRKSKQFGLWAAVAAAVAIPTAQTQGAGPNPFPAKVTKDKVAARPGSFLGGSGFAPGHSGQASDYSAAFPVAPTGSVFVQDGSFINAGASKDALTVALWAKHDAVRDSSGFWLHSPSSNNGERGFQAHLPWSNNNIYFDTAGCCNSDQRINAAIDTFSGYDGGDTPLNFWSKWHHYVFVKNAGVKQIYIDGVLFLEDPEADAAPLTPDFTKMYIGAGADGGSNFAGSIDDFAVFSTALTDAQAKSLFTGTKPDALGASAGLIGYWDFNDFPAEGVFTTVSPAPNTLSGSPNTILIVHQDGSFAWSQNNVTLKLDGAVVPATVTKDGNTTTVKYVSPTLLPMQSTHSISFTFPGSGGAQTYDWQFTVGTYTADTVASRLGTFRGGSSFTPNSGGRSGQPGDYALNFPVSGSGPVVVSDASFFNTGAAKDELSLVFWTKKYDIAAGSAFWANSPVSNNGQRGYQAHVPWNNNNVYFDSAGCCNPDTRISADIATLPTFTGDTTDISWWTNSWHQFVFSKKGANKQIWVDGQLFLEGTEAAPLPTDFTDLFIGSDGSGNGLFHGLVDDFSVFSTQLTEAQVKSLFTGAKPATLPASAGLLANWEFNDLPADGLFVSFSPTPDSTNAAPNLIRVVHLQGNTAWDLNKVSLSVDGQPVTAKVTRDAGRVTVEYVPSTIFKALSKHSATLSYPSSGGATLTKSWEFTVGQYTVDTVAKNVGLLTGAAKFTADKGGKSGAAGDYAIDLGPSQAGQSVTMNDASFMNVAAANDEMATVGWQKLYSVHDSAFVWGVSPGSNGSSRGWGTHTPWSNNNLYFDTAGCCDASQRTSAGIDTFSGYTGDIGYWTNWHHFVFQKKGSTKQIWIDGLLFTEGENDKPLPTDFSTFYVGYNPADNVRLQGLVDDVAVFGTALTEADITKLASGTAPSALPASDKLVAYWNFNDASSTPVGTPTLSIARNANGKIQITYTGTLESADTLKSTGTTWSSVSNASSPYDVPTTDAKRFYRAKQ